MTCSQSQQLLCSTSLYRIGLLALCLLSQLIYCSGAASYCGREPSAAQLSPPEVFAEAANLKACPQLRIGIFNGVDWHYEVLSGLLHVLRPYHGRTDVYMLYKPDGVWPLIKNINFNVHWLIGDATYTTLSHERPIYDLAIFISPGYEIPFFADILQYIRPRLTFAIFHEHVGRVPSILGILHAGMKRYKILALSPHVATFLANATGHPVDWMTATFAYEPLVDCATAADADLMGSCLQGFSVQGNFQKQRRNYVSLWKQLQKRKMDLEAEDISRLSFKVDLVGQGRAWTLGIPWGIKSWIKTHNGLGFCPFYEAIHHTFGLLPLFSNDEYLTSKMSSTIITSLTTGTPIVADSRFLAVYNQFSERSVFLQREGEQEVDAMLRVMRMSPHEVRAVRRAVIEVRNALNRRAAKYFADELRELCASRSGFNTAASA